MDACGRDDDAAPVHGRGGVVESESVRGCVAHAQTLWQDFEVEARCRGDEFQDVVPCRAVGPSGEVVECAGGDEGRVFVFGFDCDVGGALNTFGPVDETAAAFEEVLGSGWHAFDEADRGVEAGQVWRERDGDGAVLVF